MSEPLWRHTGAAAGARIQADANLPHRRDIAFRLGSSAQFYRELLARLRGASSIGPDGARQTPFAGMSRHGDTDWITGLLLAWSDAGDVLSFYQERLINEGYLRTARDPQSLELLLSGGLGVRRGVYGVSPGDSTGGTVTVGLDPGCAALVDVLLSVAETRGMPRRVAVPAGTGLRMISPSGDGTTYFETDQAITLRREWNAMAAFAPPAARSNEMAGSAPGVLLDGSGTGLRQGDRILLTGRGGDGRAAALLRTVVSAQSLPDAGVTEVTWVPEVPDPDGVTTLRAPRLFRFRRRLALFGSDAAILATLPRRRRLDQGVDQGGVARLPSLATASAWQARNDTLPAGRFQCVLALANGDICLGTDDGAYLSQGAAPVWVAAKAGMTQRMVTTLARGPNGTVLAGTATGGVFRTENPAGGWDSLAGGFVIEGTARRPVTAKATLPSEVVRRLEYVAGFPGGAGIVALTDSGLFIQQRTGAWLTVTTRAPLDPKTRYADALFGADGASVALCHDSGIVRLTVTGAALPSARMGTTKPANGGPGKAIAAGLAGLTGLLRREEAALRRRLASGPYPDRLRLPGLGARQPMALAPLSDRLGAGDLLMGTSIGAVICDAQGGLWGASNGLPLGADGAPVAVSRLAWSGGTDGITVLTAVGPGGDGQGAGIYRFATDRLMWDRLTESVPAEGPVLLSLGEDGAVVSAQTPVPATEWPGFSLAGPQPGPAQDPAPVPPADAPDTRAVSLDLDTPTQGLAPGGMAVLHDPVANRMTAGPLIEAPLLMLEGFGLKHRVSRAWVALPKAEDLAGFGRRQSAVYADSTELTPLGPDATVRRPVGLGATLALDGLITDLATPDTPDDGTAHAARRVRARPGPTAPRTEAQATTVPVGMPPTTVRRMAISGRGARLLPALLGGVVGLADLGPGRPGRALGYCSVRALARRQAVLLAGCADGTVYRSADGRAWLADAPVPDSCGGLHTLLVAGDRLFAAGPAGIAVRTDGDWQAAAAIPGKRRITCLAWDAAGTLWAGTDSGLFGSGDQGATWRLTVGGRLDPDTAVTALLPLADGGTLMGTDGDGVLHLDRGATAWMQFAGPIGRGRVSCLAGAGGKVLAGTPDAGAFTGLVGQAGWWAAGLAADLPVTAVACTAGSDIVALGGGGLFCRDTADGDWRRLPLGLTGTLTCLVLPQAAMFPLPSREGGGSSAPVSTPPPPGPLPRGEGEPRRSPADVSTPPPPGALPHGEGEMRWPFLLVGAEARLPFGATAEAGELRLEPVATLHAGLAPLLAAGVLGPAARQELVQAGLTLAKDAALAPLPSGTGWSLGSTSKGDVPLYLLPGAEAITVAKPSQPPLRAGAARAEGGTVVLDAIAVTGAALTVRAYAEELLFLPAEAADPLLSCVRDIMASQPAEDGASTTVVLEAAPGMALDAATLNATANVVGASEGRTVLDEVLGDGNSDLTHQRFRLRQAPLTILPGPPPVTRRSTLTVSVNGEAWREVASFAGTAAQDHVYIVGIDATGSAQIAFGDGEQGARLPTGVGNVRASYRHGMGSMPDALPLDQQPSGATHLAYLMAGSGGLSKDAKVVTRSTARPPASTQVTALALPGRARLRNRLVTPGDYERLLASAPGVAHARTDSVALPGARPVLLVSIAAVPGAAGVLDRVRTIVAASQAAGARPALVLDCEAVPIRLAVRLWVEERADTVAVTSQAGNALRQRFGYTARGLARDVLATDILAVLQRLSGVAGAEIDHLHRATEAEANLPRISALPGRYDGTACRAAQLAYLPEDGGALMVSVAPRSGLVRP